MAQNRWEPVGNIDFRDAYNFGGGNVAIAASSGSLYWSSDDCVSFHTQPLDDSSGLNSVQFQGSFGIAGGDSNRVFTSSDGGATWNKHYLPSLYGINKLTFAGTDTIFACGNRSTILRSTDGASHWTMQTAPGNCNLFRIRVVTSQELFVTSDSGYLFSTLDGGEHWTRTHLPFVHRGPVGSFDIAPNGEWLATGDSTWMDTSTASCVGMSTNNGLTWDVHCIDTFIFAPIYAKFLSNDTIVAIRAGFYRFVSTDDGLSWVSIDVRQNGNYPFGFANYNGFWQTDAGGLRVYGDYGTLLDAPNATSTGGVIHTYSVLGNGGQTFFEGLRNDAAVLHGVNGSGGFVFSSDGGASWLTRSDPNFNFATYMGIHFANDSTGVLLTSQSNTKSFWPPYSTTNNGMTWQKILPTQMPHEAWFFSTIGSNGNLFATSDTGIDYSADSGILWSRWGGYREPYDSNAHVLAFEIMHASFFGQDTAYLHIHTIGNWPSDVFLITYDHGTTWKRSIIDAGYPFSMDFISPSVGVFALDGGNIYRTSDGGNNWSLIHIAPYSYRLWSVDFNRTASLGVVCGDSGFVAYSLDSGQTWHPESVPKFGIRSYGLTRAYALSDTTFLIQGDYSLYLKTFHLSTPPASITPGLAQYVFLRSYPNPASGQIHCVLNGLHNNPGARLDVELFDIMGRKVMDVSDIANLGRNGDNSDFEIDGSSLPPGVYTIHYQLGGYSYGLPVVIIH